MADIKPDLQAIFQQAVELDSPEQIVQYLDNACGDDRELRAEVEALISSHRGAGNFLGGTASQATVDLRPTEKPGTQIGRYKLLQQIGEGGMGSVYMAEQMHPVQRMVALKVVKAGLDSRQIVARFEAERQSLAMMDHPNIAKVLDAGETDRGEPYFVMELVKGVPIKQYCDDNRLSTHDRIKLIVDVCSAVQHAHQKGIIHRDLKPSNILVAQYDDRPVPKVIDFGVAKATHQKLTEKTLYTQLGQIVGTLEYMSPEQAVLNQLDVDTRTDVYSLGVILYELLVGETPLNSKALRSQGLDQILRTIREEEPPRPSLRLSSQGQAATQTAAYHRTDQNSLSKTLRGDLDWIVMKALEKDRKRRYDSASRLADDLRNYLSGAVVEARPPTVGYRLKKSWQRNRVLFSSTAAVILTLSVCLYVMFQEYRDNVEALRVNIEQKTELIEQKTELEKQKSKLEIAQGKLRSTLVEKQETLVQKEEALAWVRDYCMLLAMSGEPEDEQLALQIANQTNEPRTWQLALRGNAEYYRGNEHEAVMLLEEGLELEPTNIVLKGLLSIAYAAVGDFKHYFETSTELASLTEDATNEELVYVAWGMISDPKNALSMIRRVQSQRDSPLVDLVYGDIVAQLLIMTPETQLVEPAIEKLESSRKLIGNTPHFNYVGLKLRHAAILFGSRSPEEKERLHAQAQQCISRLDDMPSSLSGLVQTAFYLHHFGSEQERSSAWDRLLQSKGAGGWQTYAIRARTLRTGSFREAAAALEANTSTIARFWKAYCLHRAGDTDLAEKLYQDIKRDGDNLVIHSHLYYLEFVGPLQRLKKESREYLDAGEFPSEITKLKAEFCLDPSEQNEQRLRQLGNTLAIARGITLGTIGRVRMLQASEAPPNSHEQTVARDQAMQVLDELIRSRAFQTGDYFWADSMKQIKEDEWAQADLGQ